MLPVEWSCHLARTASSWVHMARSVSGRKVDSADVQKQQTNMHAKAPSRSGTVRRHQPVELSSSLQQFLAHRSVQAKTPSETFSKHGKALKLSSMEGHMRSSFAPSVPSFQLPQVELCKETKKVQKIECSDVLCVCCSLSIRSFEQVVSWCR